MNFFSYFMRRFHKDHWLGERFEKGLRVVRVGRLDESDHGGHLHEVLAVVHVEVCFVRVLDVMKCTLCLMKSDTIRIVASCTASR